MTLCSIFFSKSYQWGFTVFSSGPLRPFFSIMWVQWRCECGLFCVGLERPLQYCPFISVFWWTLHLTIMPWPTEDSSAFSAAPDLLAFWFHAPFCHVPQVWAHACCYVAYCVHCSLSEGKFLLKNCWVGHSSWGFLFPLEHMPCALLWWRLFVSMDANFCAGFQHLDRGHLEVIAGKGRCIDE